MKKGDSGGGSEGKREGHAPDSACRVRKEDGDGGRRSRLGRGGREGRAGKGAEGIVLK